MNKRLVLTAIIIATLMCLVWAHYQLTLRSASKEVLKTPKALKILSDISYVEQIQSGEKTVTFFVVAGVIENNLSTSVCSVNVTTTFYDSEGKTIGNSPLLAHAELQIIESGKRSPFKTYLSLDAFTPIPSRYQINASCFETVEDTVKGVEVIDQTAGFDKEGYHRVVGEVQNNWRTNAIGVKLICAYYNETGHLIAMSDTVFSTAIGSGSKVTFDLSSEPFRINPASYELFVVVHHYNPLPFTRYLLFFAMLTLVLIFIVYMKRVRGW